MRDMSSYGSPFIENTDSEALPDLSRMSTKELVTGMTSIIENDTTDAPGAFGNANADLIASYEETILENHQSMYGSALVSAVWQLCKNPDSSDERHTLNKKLFDDAIEVQSMSKEELFETLRDLFYPGLPDPGSWEFLQCQLESTRVFLSRASDPLLRKKLSDEIERIQSWMSHSPTDVIDL